MTPEEFARLEPEQRRAELETHLDAGLMLSLVRLTTDALATYARVAVMGEPIFATLSVEEQAVVLKARFNASLIHWESANSAGAIAEYAQVAGLGEPVFATLHEQEQTLVLAARVNAGAMRGRAGEIADALAQFTRVADLSESAFNTLHMSGRSQVFFARINAGDVHLQAGDTTSALAEYARVGVLGEPIFGILDEAGREGALRARIKAGDIHLQAGDTTRALAEYARVGVLGEPVFGMLDAKGREAILTAGVKTGDLHRQTVDSESALAAYARVMVLGNGPAFETLDAQGREAVLRAGTKVGTIFMDASDTARALEAYLQVVTLGEPNFETLDSEGRWAVLSSCFNAGAALLHPLKDLKGAVAAFRCASALGEPHFKTLATESQTVVLHACFNAGATLWEMGSAEEALAEFMRGVALGEPAFTTLSARGQAMVLGAHGGAGPVRAFLGDAAGELNEYACVAELGEPIFDELDAAGRTNVLTARMNAGVALGKSGDSAKELAAYAQVLALGEPVFQFLDATGKRQVLMAYLYRGMTLDSLEDVSGTLAAYARVADLGARFFNALDAPGRSTVLAALANTGDTHAQLRNVPQELAAYARVTDLGEPVFESLDVRGRWQVLRSRMNAAITVGFMSARGLDHKSKVLWPLAFQEPSSFAKLIGSCKALASALVTRFDFSQAMEAARWWIVDLRSFPAHPAHLRQRQQVLELTQAFVLFDLVARRARHRRWLSEVSDEVLSGNASAENLLTAIARWIAESIMASLQWADDVDRSDALLLARVRSAAAGTAGWPDKAPWRTSPAALYQDLRIEELFFDDQSDAMRLPYAMLQVPDDARLRFTAFAQTANLQGGELEEALVAWRHKDPSGAVALLERAWQRLGAGDGASADPPDGDLARLTLCLERLDAQDARESALNALIYGDAQQVLLRLTRVWLQSRLSVAGPGPQALNGILRDLLEGVLDPVSVNVPSSRSAVLERLHTFVTHDDAVRQAPEERWEALELGRFALASAALSQPEPRPSDAEAGRALLAALQTEQAMLAARIERHEAGKSTAVSDPDRDVTYGLFDTLVQQCRRLDYTLKLPRPEACAAALRDDEHLIQFWFDSAGGAHALVLSAGREGLRDVALPPELARPCWQTLLDSWSAISVGEQAAWDGKPFKHVPANQRREALAALQQAWELFVAEDSPASRLLQELARLTSAVATAAGGVAPPAGCCSLLLPADIAMLPWLARAVSGTVPDLPDFAAAAIVLEPSVSAWLLARRAAASDVAPAGAPAHVVHTSEAIQLVDNDGREQQVPFGDLEAEAVASRLGCHATPAGGMIELLRALQEPGPAHLSVHGSFVPLDPQRSHFSLDRGSATLPAWLLQDVDVQGDISLAACDAMLVGSGTQGASRWTGPVGLGPLLRARGARTVVGALGKSNALASWMFYPLWYEARCRLPAAQALAEAQRRLKDMPLADVRQRILALPDEALHNPLLDELNAMLAEGSERPFAHPAFWAQFTLLGDAAVLRLPHPAGPAGDRGPRSGRRPWWGSWWGSWCRAWRARPAAGPAAS